MRDEPAEEKSIRPIRDGSRFRILDLVVLVGASAVGFASWDFIARKADMPDVGEAAFWLIVGGVALVGYGSARFATTREARLIVVGVAVAFAALALAVYLGYYLRVREGLSIALFGLVAVALVLVAGGVGHGFLTRWHELRAGPIRATDQDRSKSS